jgi:hypothetical protein
MTSSKPGRPSLDDGRTPNVSLRLPLKLTAMVDHWRERQADKPNRNEAIRRLLEFAVALDPQLDGKDE